MAMYERLKEISHGMSAEIRRNISYAQFPPIRHGIKKLSVHSQIYGIEFFPVSVLIEERFIVRIQVIQRKQEIGMNGGQLFQFKRFSVRADGFFIPSHDAEEISHSIVNFRLKRRFIHADATFFFSFFKASGRFQKICQII